jgi:ribosomal-protein-alanine N-acetyltransferase
MKPFALEAFEPPLALPILRSGPALLRPFAGADVEMVVQASRDPYIPHITSMVRDGTELDAQSFIARQHDRAAAGDGYSLVVAREAEPERGLGSVGLWLRDIENGRATAGYWLVDAARGDGLAGWALRAMVTFAFMELAIPRLQLYIEPWNVASARTAAAGGFTFEAHLKGWERIGDEQHDADCYGLLRDGWVSQ